MTENRIIRSESNDVDKIIKRIFRNFVKIKRIRKQNEIRVRQIVEKINRRQQKKKRKRRKSLVVAKKKKI